MVRMSKQLKPTDSLNEQCGRSRDTDGIKGQGGEEVIDENPEFQALEGAQDTPLHHSHTHTRTSLSVLSTPSELFDPTDTLKMTHETAKRHPSP